MTLKNAAFLALIAAILLTILQGWRLVFGILNAARGLIPALTVISLFIYAFAALSLLLFFFAFHRTQSR
jgi:hypothetical protein